MISRSSLISDTITTGGLRQSGASRGQLDIGAKLMSGNDGKTAQEVGTKPKLCYSLFMYHIEIFYSYVEKCIPVDTVQYESVNII